MALFLSLIIFNHIEVFAEVNYEKEQLETEISQKSDNLNQLYDEIDSLNKEIASKEQEQLNIEEQTMILQEDLQVEEDKIVNYLKFLQYSYTTQLVYRYLFSDDFITNAYNLGKIFSVITQNFGAMYDNLVELDNLNASYEESINTLKINKQEVQSKINDFEKTYDELNEQLQILEEEQEKEIELEYSDTAVIPQNKQEQYMAEAGISPSDYEYVDYVVTVESSWNYTATNPYSGAYGLCQALPGEKMSQFGADWKDNPTTQLKFCDSYANSRYGSWEEAASFMKGSGWW